MKSIIISICLLIPIWLFGQGQLLLVGGGAELDETWSWSNTPYQWAVEQSGNKKVAIIAFGESSDPEWLPNYFESLGAVEATNFIINTLDSAQSDQTYNVLMSYDVLFFKGGDQGNYYETYINSSVSAAMQDKYNAGGVIGGTSAGMAILSNPMYTAENGTLFPDEILENAAGNKMTLANDFVSLLNNTIVDTHFIERGRMARLIGFMGYWSNTQAEAVKGIGVDDRTALCIDENLMATAYGTGAVSIFHGGTYQNTSEQLQAEEIQTIQLLHGARIDLNNLALTENYDLDQNQDTAIDGSATIYLGATTSIAANQGFLDEMVAAGTTSFVVVSPGNSSLAAAYSDYLEDAGAQIIQVDPSSQAETCDLVAVRNAIRSSNGFVILDNSLDVFMNFLNTTETGQVLLDHLNKDEAQVAFIGDNTKLAGTEYVVNNTTDALNSYFGELEFEQGINLVKNSLIVNEAYDPSSTDFYENNTSAIYYSLIASEPANGFLINEDSYLKFYRAENEYVVDAFGQYAAIHVKNAAMVGAIADQQVNSSGNTRNVVGFDQMQIDIFHEREQTIGTYNSYMASNEFEVTVPGDFQVNEGLLTWTYDGSNPDQFIIERKSTGDFTTLAELEGNVFEYQDNSTEANVLYTYRMFAVVGETNSCFTPEAQVRIVTSFENYDFSKDFQVYPNPVTSGRLYFEREQNSTIELYELSGRKYQMNIVNNSSSADVSFLKSGIYIIKIQTSQGVKTERVVIIND